MIVRGEQKAYYQQAEGELSVILSNFDTNFIYGTIEDFIDERNKEFVLEPRANFVNSLEATFKDTLATYPTDRDNIIFVRQQTYREIIRIISSKTGIRVLYDEDTTDIFALAKYMYDLIIAEYDLNVFNFLFNFIMTQKDYIYNTLDMDQFKKSKDITTLYNRQLYSDTKLAIVNANLDQCMRFISNMEFTPEDFLGYVYYNRQHTIRNYLTNHIDSTADLYSIMVKPLCDNPYTYAPLITSVRLEIQRRNVIPVEKYKVL